MENTYGLLVDLCQRLIEAGRRAGTIPEGPPAKVVAPALGFPGGRLTRATVGLDRLRLDEKVSGMSIALAVNFAARRGFVTPLGQWHLLAGRVRAAR